MTGPPVISRSGSATDSGDTPIGNLKSLSPVSLGPGFIVGKRAKNGLKQRKKSVREASREVDALSPPQIPVRLANVFAFSPHYGVCSRAIPGLLVCMKLDEFLTSAVACHHSGTKTRK